MSPRFHPALIIATVLGVGYLPRAPGTAGTLAAVPLCFALSGLSVPWFALVTLGVSLLGIWASHHAERLLPQHDSQEIVIDEVAGYMLTVLFVDRSSWLWLFIGFLVFRTLDIWKPFPIRWIDKHVRGGFGVMADDLAAGAIGTLLVFVASVVFSANPAFANGRFPATVNVKLSSDPQRLIVPATFGLLLSDDGGESFRWVCEEAIGYGGTYDPDYAVAPDGRIFATTFAGLRVSKDNGCSFQTLHGPFSNQWVGDIELDNNGRLWATTSTGGIANDVYFADDGESFQSAGLHAENVWWLSVRAAPSLPERVYVTGYTPALPDPMGGGTLAPSSQILRSDDGGVTWNPLPISDFALRPVSQIILEAVTPENPDVLFARVVRARDPIGDAIYRSRDGGAHWTKIIDMPNAIRAFLLRNDGHTLIVGSDSACDGDAATADKGCVLISENAVGPAAPVFVPAAAQPKMACLGESVSGTLYACGANWEPDFFGLAQSTDAATWSPVMRFGDISGPLSCGADTIQMTSCARIQWPNLCEQLDNCGGATATPGEDTKSGGCALSTFAQSGLILVLLLLIARFRR